MSPEQRSQSASATISNLDRFDHIPNVASLIKDAPPTTTTRHVAEDVETNEADPPGQAGFVCIGTSVSGMHGMSLGRPNPERRTSASSPSVDDKARAQDSGLILM